LRFAHGAEAGAFLLHILPCSRIILPADCKFLEAWVEAKVATGTAALPRTLLATILPAHFESPGTCRAAFAIAQSLLF
jgi:hypothetical protein